ncbi:MAG: class I SAM-dependent methyltransferase [Methanomassiliicoccales archaeon]|nr:MAG: class I SAM-dependent methyltransferase [Methanomassiliicoccales archaeon]
MLSRDIIMAQLRRQARWLSESRRWLIQEVMGKEGSIKTALDVGCGPGFIQKELRETHGIHAIGIDKDREMLRSAREMGLDILQANGHDIPFKDSCFDMVYCTFTLMWVKDPVVALKEMRRVSKKWVVCFAEPDYGARVDYPEALSDLAGAIADSIERDNGDPIIGRKLRAYFSQAGMEAKIGVFDSIWSIERLESEFRDEWDFLRASTSMSSNEMDKYESVAKEAIENKSRMQFTPIFYALAKVSDLTG